MSTARRGGIRRYLSSLVGLGLVGCVGDWAAEDGVDSAISVDAASVDAGAVDAGTLLVREHVGSVVELVPNGDTLYWSDLFGAIWKMPVAGGEVTPLLLAARGTRLFYVDVENFYVSRNGGIFAYPKDGTPNERRIAESPRLSAVAARGGRIFWVEGKTASVDEEWIVKAVKIDGTGAETLATFSMEPIFGAPAIAVTSSMVVVGNRTVALRFPSAGIPNGGEPEQVSAVGCERVIADEQDAYCVSLGGPITKVTSDGAGVVLVANANATNAAVDGTDLYWSSNDPSIDAILKVSKQGGPTLRVGDQGGSNVGVDATAVYWESHGAMKRRLK